MHIDELTKINDYVRERAYIINILTKIDTSDFACINVEISNNIKVKENITSKMKKYNKIILEEIYDELSERVQDIEAQLIQHNIEFIKYIPVPFDHKYTHDALRNKKSTQCEKQTEIVVGRIYADSNEFGY